MNKIKEILTRLPAWILSMFTIMLILWLTLAPDPLGDETPMLFPGADKVVHALMFGSLTVMLLLDKERKSEWQLVSRSFISIVAVAVVGFGIAIEFIQRAMEMGRGFEVTDMIADCLGVALCAFGWAKFQYLWSKPEN